jgi:hypothetical protein
VLFQIVPDRYDGAGGSAMCLFSIYQFLDATGNDVHDIQPMSIPASRLKIKENEKGKDNYFLIKLQL